MGVEELAILARLFGVSVSVTHVEYNLPPADDQVATKLHDLAVMFPYIPNAVRYQTWLDVASSRIQRERSLNLIDTVKNEVSRRLRLWPDKEPVISPSSREPPKWRKDKPTLAFIGGVHRTYLVLLHPPWDKDMEWCPAWMVQGELVYSRAPWKEMRVWQACLMAMGIGIHGIIKWYERNTLIPDSFIPRLKSAYKGQDVTQQQLHTATKQVITALLQTVQNQPHILYWEHRVCWLAKGLDPLDKRYWSQKMFEKWLAWKTSGTHSEGDELIFITSQWYEGGRLAINPPEKLIEDGRLRR